MFNQMLARVFGSRNQRVVKRMASGIKAAAIFEDGLKALSDDALRARTDDLKARLAGGATLDQLQAEAFATVREAARRVLGMRHFDVQIVGGTVLHQGKIAEMKTGEGKTLMATLPVYLNALSGKGVHVVTVNDYLARRDAEWMGRLYNFLGMSVGVVVAGQTQEEKRAAYAADITYGTNNEFGFDYLRDNMAFSLKDKTQRGQHFAIVDEVDSILIDEARTPLIISGPTDDDPALWGKLNAMIPKLVRQTEEDGEGDFWADEKSRQVHLSEAGMEHVEDLLRGSGMLAEDEALYDAANIVLVHHLNALLRAHHLYRRDVEYIVRNGQVVIIDEFTGRMMAGRRWSDGLHQAVEAKEGVAVQQENQTLASITFQNYFRLYKKLAGMTGTADTEAFEFQNIYGLEVVVVPTNKPMTRLDRGDQVFMNADDKFAAVIKDIVEAHGKRQPVLVGTASIESSELLAKLLVERGIAHEVLNAKQHEREAEIIAQAGRPGAVTIATNMAGRGTDIVLGGALESELAPLAEDDEAGRAKIKADWQQRHDAVIAAGGLLVVGSERHESRRIDNQLRGRSGRQGDPGETRFYLSLDDTLMRIFTPPRMRAMLKNLGLEPGEAIEHRWVTRAIETAQRKVESHNFDMRKNLLEYDNVANDQRKVVYELRDQLMGADKVTGLVESIRPDVVTALIDAYIPPQSVESMWNVKGLEETLKRDLALDAPIQQWLDEDDALNESGLRKKLLAMVADGYTAKKASVGDSVLEHFEKAIMLQTLDQFWREHLSAMDYLRLGIHLRGYAQKDPKQEYKREAFSMFSELLARFKFEVTSILARVRIQTQAEVEAVEAERRRASEAMASKMQAQHADAAVLPSNPLAEQQGEPGAPPPAGPPAGPSARSLNTQRAAPPPAKPSTVTRDMPKVGRNDPCPCGSGKKYKQCHGQL